MRTGPRRGNRPGSVRHIALAWHSLRRDSDNETISCVFAQAMVFERWFVISGAFTLIVLDRRTAGGRRLDGA